MSTAARAIGNLNPAYFALVMATGIISVAAHQLGLGLLADVLLALNLVFYPLLWLLTIARLVWFPRRFFADLGDHARGAGNFTAAAATCVLGSRAGRSAGSGRRGHGAVGPGHRALAGGDVRLLHRSQRAGSEAAAGDGALPALAVVRGRRPVGRHPRRSVGPGPPWRSGHDSVLCISRVAGSGRLYSWLITLIFFRCTFVLLTPAEVTPPYVVNMGAMAISTLAGCELVEAAGSPLLRDLAPFLRGVTILYWAAATFWLPLLLALVGWKYGYAHAPLRYESSDWGAVFPLGTYTACTTRLVEVFGLPFLLAVPPVFLVVALVGWTVGLLGLIGNLFHFVPGQPSEPTAGSGEAAVQRLNRQVGSARHETLESPRQTRPRHYPRSGVECGSDDSADEDFASLRSEVGHWSGFGTNNAQTKGPASALRHSIRSKEPLPGILRESGETFQKNNGPTSR